MIDGYIVISNLRVQPVTIVRRKQGFIIVEFPGSAENARIRIRENRLFSTEEEAKEHTHEYIYEPMGRDSTPDKKLEPYFYLQGY